MSDRIRRALRNLDAETAVTMVLHAVIPFSTLFWTLWGSFGFWTDVFGSPLLAFGAMIAVESIALIGFVMYVADWSPGSWVRRMRHCLPIIPSFQLLHTLHTVIAPNSFTFDLATRMQWTVDIASWMIAAAFTFIFSVISFGAWESFGQTLRNPYAWRLARIQREFERKQKEIEIQRAQLEAECELARLGALMIRDEKVASLSNEQLRLSAMIPVDEAMLLAKRQRYAAVSEALRRIQFPTSPDVSAPMPLAAPSNGSDSVSLAAPSNGSDPVEHIALSEDEEKLIRFACAAYLLGIGASLAYAASQCNVPRTTLRDRVHNAEGATRYVEIACSRLSPQGAAEFHRRSREEEQKFLLQRLHRQEQ